MRSTVFKLWMLCWTLGFIACGGGGGGAKKLSELEGAWVICDDADCASTGGDGLLFQGREMTKIRVPRGLVAEVTSFCTTGSVLSFSYDGSALELSKSDGTVDARMEASIDEDAMTLVDESDSANMLFARRLAATSRGACGRSGAPR